VLSAGQHLDKVAHDPIWAAAMASSGPWVLLDKWRRFEGFAHWNNRTRQSALGDNSVGFERFGMDGQAPGGPENLLICGLLTGLLKRVGCEGLVCRLGQRQDLLVDGNGEIQAGSLDLDDTDQWQISWTNVRPRTEPRDTAVNFRNLPLTRKLGPSLLRIVELLQQDPSRTWSLTDAARSVGMSARTLQRRLQDADLSFSRVTRLIRIQEASELLAKSDLPVTVIGFCAGFSDSAHFSRDFNLSTGMSPTAFRKLAQASDASA
jgi:AraC-like DNA-binding protein